MHGGLVGILQGYGAVLVDMWDHLCRPVVAPAALLALLCWLELDWLGWALVLASHSCEIWAELGPPLRELFHF